MIKVHANVSPRPPRPPPQNYASPLTAVLDSSLIIKNYALDEP